VKGFILITLLQVKNLYLLIERMSEYRQAFPRGSNHSKNSAEARRIGEDVHAAKEKVRSFFGAHDYELAITSGTTESSRLIATRADFKADDIAMITYMEHTSSMVTQRNFARQAGARVKYVPVLLPCGRLDLNELSRISKKRKERYG
jgi:cysteine desulfurase/selenocysteine lyase